MWPLWTRKGESHSALPSRSPPGRNIIPKGLLLAHAGIPLRPGLMRCRDRTFPLRSQVMLAIASLSYPASVTKGCLEQMQGQVAMVTRHSSLVSLAASCICDFFFFYFDQKRK